MSKQPDPPNDQRNSQLTSMSSRQQINFLLNKTQNHKDWTIEYEAKDDLDSQDVIDYETYWEEHRKEVVYKMILIKSKFIAE